ncbi:hypothetical protein FRC17_009545 [Serendipita sp. 399]|nr:hypothetical protein FRC17_009545 [Serendipita sp. 399]
MSILYEVGALIPTTSSGSSSSSTILPSVQSSDVEPLSLQSPGDSEGSDYQAQPPTPTEEEVFREDSEPPTPTTVQEVKPPQTNGVHGPTIDTEHQGNHRDASYDPPTPRPTPIRTKPPTPVLDGISTSSISRIIGVPANHVLQEAAKWDLPNLEQLDLTLHEDIAKLPFESLNPFLNIHGHKLRQLTLRDTNPLVRSTPLSVSSILSRCPNLETLCVVASSTMPLMLSRPHLSLRSIRFMGIAPGSKRDIGGEVGLGHLLALQADNVEAREKLPTLEEVIIQGEEDPVELQALRFLWEDTLGARSEDGLRVICVNQEGEVMQPQGTAFMASISSSGANRAMWDNLGEVEEGDEDEWLPDEEDEEREEEEEEDAEWEAMGDDDEKSDDETVRDSRSGRGRDDDQVDHTTALLIFQDTRLRRSRPPFMPFSGPEGWTMGSSRPAHTDSEAKPIGGMTPREMVNGWAANSLSLNGLNGNEGPAIGPPPLPLPQPSTSSSSLRHSTGPGSGTPTVVGASRHAVGGSARAGSVDLKRHSLGPGSMSKIW